MPVTCYGIFQTLIIKYIFSVDDTWLFKPRIKKKILYIQFVKMYQSSKFAMAQPAHLYIVLVC